MKNCIYLKQKFNHKFECKKNKQEICLKECSNCPYKEYKKCIITVKKSTYKWKNAQKSPVYCAKMKQRSSKLSKLERNRFSLFTDNMNKCYFCPNKKDHIHEIFCGRNRQNSMKYGLCLPICESCHSKYQNDFLFNEKWHKKGQAIFNKAYPDLKFEDIFKKNYL
mgnify:FL=1